MSSIFFKNKYYTEKEFLDELNELEDYISCTHTERQGKMAVGKWSPGAPIEQEELDRMIPLAQELSNMHLLDESWEVREEILYCLADIFTLYRLQGKNLVNLDKLRTVADQLEKSFDEYLEEIL